MSVFHLKNSIHNFLSHEKLVFSVLLLVLLLPSCVFAFNPSLPNNKFGIHLAVPQSDDIDKAAELVNSSGGKWGYVTLVIQEDDRKQDKWQQVFDQLRQNHLIPVIRIATHPVGDKWRKPTIEDVDDWISFLDSLNWVVKDRYVVLFNEPNQGNEWGGAVDPADYGNVAEIFAEKLKGKNGNFFVMLAGLDSSAPSNRPFLEDESAFLSQMKEAVPDLFNRIDGWTSHSYPNPGFAGSPLASGRGTVRGYDWELSQLRQLGITKELPVFITETGWSNQVVSLDQIAEDLRTAYENWLADARVRAVTPFVLNYQGEPFLKFSWKKYLRDDFYPQFESIKQIPKTKGQPEQEERGSIQINLPRALLVDSNYHFFIPLQNNGQAIWDKNDGYFLKLKTAQFQNYFFSDLQTVEPGERVDLDLFFKTAGKPGTGEAQIALYKEDKKILGTNTWYFEMLPLPSLKFQATLFPKGTANGDRFEIQIFDERQELVFKQSSIKVKNGMGEVKNIHNIYLGGKYRVVLINPYYLPRQEHLVFQKTENAVRFKVMLPLDFNKDGTFDWKDLVTVFNLFFFSKKGFSQP